jgi:Uma2 family endonuclease
MVLEEIKKSPELPQLLNDLQAYWIAEQERRHQFWDSISDDQKAEFINGEGVIYQSPVKRRHIKVYHNLLTKLISYVKAEQLGEVGSEKTMVRMLRNDYEPEICFFGKEKSALFDDDQYIFPVPDFIAEILSDKTPAIDRGIKFEDYALNGVAEYWIIDPRKGEVEQYLLDPVTWKYVLESKKTDGTLFSQAVKGFQIQVTNLFE